MDGSPAFLHAHTWGDMAGRTFPALVGSPGQGPGAQEKHVELSTHPSQDRASDHLLGVPGAASRPGEGWPFPGEVSSGEALASTEPLGDGAGGVRGRDWYLGARPGSLSPSPWDKTPARFVTR